MRLLTIVLITFLFSCKASKDKSIVGVQKTNKIVFKQIKYGDNSYYTKAQNIIITTQKEMDMAWGKMFGKYQKMAPIPMIDFETKQLLLTVMGEEPSGGYSTKVNSIIKTSTNMIVTIEDTKPGASCNTTSALTFPFQLIEMPRSDEKLTFVRVSKIDECK